MEDVCFCPCLSALQIHGKNINQKEQLHVIFLHLLIEMLYSQTSLDTSETEKVHLAISILSFILLSCPYQQSFTHLHFSLLIQEGHRLHILCLCKMSNKSLLTKMALMVMLSIGKTYKFSERKI